MKITDHFVICYTLKDIIVHVDAQKQISAVENERKMAAIRRQEASSAQQLSGWKVLEQGALGKLL